MTSWSFHIIKHNLRMVCNSLLDPSLFVIVVGSTLYHVPKYCFTSSFWFCSFLRCPFLLPKLDFIMLISFEMASICSGKLLCSLSNRCLRVVSFMKLYRIKIKIYHFITFLPTIHVRLLWDLLPKRNDSRVPRPSSILFFSSFNSLLMWFPYAPLILIDILRRKK